MGDEGGSSGQVPVPYAGSELAPHAGYLYPDYAMDGGDAANWDRMAKLLWARKWWVLVGLLLGSSVGYGATRLLRPEWETGTTIWISRNDSRAGAIVAEEAISGEGYADVLTSRAVIEPIVIAHRLYVTPIEPQEVPSNLFESFEIGRDYVPDIYTLSVQFDGSFTLSRDGAGVLQRGEPGAAVGGTAGFTWRPPAGAVEPGSDLRFRVTTPQSAAGRLLRRLKVNYNQKSFVIAASLTWSDRVEAAEILNAIVTQFLKTTTDLKAQKIRQEVDMLANQTEFARERLEEALLALEEHRIATITLPSEPFITPAVPTGQGASVAGDPVFNAFFTKRLTADQLQVDLSDLVEILDEIVAGGRPNAIALQLIQAAQSNSALQAVLSQLTQLEVSRRTLLNTYTAQYPGVQELASQIDALERITIPGIVSDIIDQTRRELESVNAQIANQETELRQIPGRTIEGARRQREVTMAEALHTMLLSRLKEAQLAEATSGPAIQVLDPAFPPNAPIRNSGPRVMMLFTLAGIGLGLGSVLLYDRLDKRIRYPEQVTEALGLPLLGVVPLLKTSTAPDSPAAAIAIESFRGLRTQIAHSDGQIGGIQLVTSPLPREGKSMVAANLAISYATAGYRTLLLDADTRRGRAVEMFGLERSPGLTDYLMELVELAGVLQSSQVEYLSVIARGKSSGFNADLLEGERMDGLMAELRDRYDIIIMDGPPLAAGADALILGEQCDKVVVVLRAGTTKEDLARAKLQMLGNVQLPIIGAVLNAMPKSTPYYDHYVHYYYAEAELAS